VLEETFALNVSSTAAELRARVNPNFVDTSAYFQYGTSTVYGAQTPTTDLGSGPVAAIASAPIEQLQPGTTYHYRIVGHNEHGSSYGPDETLTTQPLATGQVLTDGRQYELVSPAEKHGAEVNASVGGESSPWVKFDGGGGMMQAAENGSAVTYTTFPAPEADPPAQAQDSQLLSRRGPEGWSTQDISTPNTTLVNTPIGSGLEFRGFSSDLSKGVVRPPALESPLPIETEHPVETMMWLRDDVTGTYKPLVSSVPAGTTSLGGLGEADFLEGTPDFSHIVFTAQAALTPNAKQAPDTSYNLYEWSANGLELINELPDGEVVAGEAGLGRASGQGEPRHAISNDGSHVIWEDNLNQTFYDRDTVSEKSVEIGSGKFETASADGSRVFFTKGDLYEYNLASGKSTDIAPGSNVQGVINDSEDGSYIYFVGKGKLASGAVGGQDNLYELHYEDTSWTPTFIATLSNQDEPDWTEGDLSQAGTARVSPDGQYLAFMSQADVTGYDNVDANSGMSDAEVYLYNAQTKQVACPSCNPTGSRPVGQYDEGSLMMDTPGAWSGRWLAGMLPTWEPMKVQRAAFQPDYLSDNGRLFFDSAEALVAQDINGREDAYEFEPNGVGSCTQAEGCVSLISGGSGVADSVFIDASADGNDVFFTSSDRLVSQDTDNARDVYDAHVCTTTVPCLAPPPTTPPPCVTSDACKPATSPQPEVFGAPATATFVGSGNPVFEVPKPAVTPKSLTRAQRLAKALGVCRKKAKKRRSVCEAQTRKRYGVKKSKSAKRSSGGARG
jgi:hypothetical protein